MPAARGRSLPPPALLLATAGIFWAGNMVVGRALRDDMPPVAMAFWRWTLAGALLLPFTWRALVAHRATLARHWKLYALLGGIGVALFNTLGYIGLQTTTATNASLFNSLIPVLIVPFAWWLLGERATARQLVAIAISLVGVTVIVTRGELATLLALALNPGDLWVLSSMSLFALYTVLVRRKPDALAGLAFLATTVAFGWPLLAAGFAIEVATGEVTHWSPRALLAIAYWGTLPSIASYWLFNRGVAAVGANRAGLYLHLVPVYGVLLSTLLLGEPPRAYHFTGMALVFVGIALASRGRVADAASTPVAPAPR
jgi:drug/metabolite transporter (DMT)-like permease